MFLHTSCSYSRYVTSSTPALASFRRPSKAAINAAGVSRCASERNRVVLPVLASSDNRLSSVDMVLDLGVSPCIPESGRPDVSPFPPVGTVAAPRRALRFPTFAGTMGSYDCSAIRPRSPLVSLGGRYLREEEIGSSLGFLENPFGSMPRARDSGGPVRPRPPGRPGTAFRSHNSVGVRHDSISELNLRGLLPCGVRFAPTGHPVDGNTGYRPAGSLWPGGTRTRWIPLRGFTGSFQLLLFQAFSHRYIQVNSRCAHHLRPPLNVERRLSG